MSTHPNHTQIKIIQCICVCVCVCKIHKGSEIITNYSGQTKNVGHGDNGKKHLFKQIQENTCELQVYDVCE